MKRSALLLSFCVVAAANHATEWIGRVGSSDRHENRADAQRASGYPIAESDEK
jgi:hypothetical protein